MYVGCIVVGQDLGVADWGRGGDKRKEEGHNDSCGGGGGDIHTVHKLSQCCLTADWLAPQ